MNFYRDVKAVVSLPANRRSARPACWRKCRMIWRVFADGQWVPMVVVFFNEMVIVPCQFPIAKIRNFTKSEFYLSGGANFSGSLNSSAD
ncbi:hypothetical protein [Thalassospira profundimaris]|uniref:hypothetical protein n=1 Tax=Thalassospira profundimaris TaxID=502049 RepID=UPI0011BF9733|nr:hypothetical protein [Thalassospira profundimaris]